MSYVSALLRDFTCLTLKLSYNSFKGSASTNGLALSLENFKDLTFDKDQSTVTVGSGWQIQQLSETIGQQYNVSFIHLREWGVRCFRYAI